MKDNRLEEGGHPRHRLDSVIHSPVRLSIMACLSAADRAEFGFVRDEVEISDSVMSKHVSILEDAGYIRVKKGYVGKFPRTWLSITAAGERALNAHLGALSDIVNATTVSDADSQNNQSRRTTKGSSTKSNPHAKTAM